MVELSAGKKLSDARLQRGLSIDAAAHATKMRPDKILALENDDYTRFGNIAYAKSFLLMYSKFLGVDVTEQSRDLDHRGNRLSIDEYQYLNNAPEPKKSTESTPARTRRERKPPSVLPLLAFLVIGICVLGWMYYHAIAPRIGFDEASTDSSATHAHDSDRAEEAPKPIPAEPEASHAPAPAVATAPASTIPAPVAPATPAVHAAIAVPVAPAPPISRITQPTLAPATPAVASVVTPPSMRESDSALLERELAERAASDRRTLSPPSPASEKDKVQIVPLRRTWVTVRLNGPDAPIAFEGVIYPEAQPLTVKTPAFIAVQDQTAVQIRKDGHPIAYQAPGISVQ